MSDSKRNAEVPGLPDTEVKKYPGFSRVRTRYRQVSHGFRKRRTDKLKNSYGFLAVLMLVLLVIMLFT